jgi:hypothetical protein
MGARNIPAMETLLGISRSGFIERLTRQLIRKGWKLSEWGFAWSIDHILPLVAFDLSDPDHLLAASHYLNLRAVSIEENCQNRRRTTSRILRFT